MAARKMTAEDLRAIKSRVGAEKTLRKDGHTARVTVHMGTCGLASEAQRVMDQFLQARSESGRSDIVVTRSGSIGLCSREPLVTVERLDQEPVIYQRVDNRKAQRIFKQHVLAGQVQVDDALARGKAVNEERPPMKSNLEGILPHISELKFFSLQQPWVLRNKGLIEPDRIDDYIWRDGYFSAAKALLEMTPSEIIGEVKISGLRGRWVGGFPVGIVLEFCANSKEEVRYVLCSADEGDPGAFVSRALIETDPHSMIEGMIISAKAIGAHRGYIDSRIEHPLLNLAVQEARDRGLLGRDILGSGFDFDIEGDEGSGPSGSTEETAWIGESAGTRTTPRPSLAAISGFRKKPTLLNNAETYVHVARIIQLGGQTYSDTGTETSKGTKLFFLTGNVKDVGLVEVPMGTPVGEIVFDLGGGIPGEKRFKAVQFGGLPAGSIPPEHLNTLIDYDALATVGVVMGSAMTVLDDDHCAVDGFRHFRDFCQDEVLGRCTSCQAETERMLEIIERITQGQGRREDIELLEVQAERIKNKALCVLGQTATNPILSTLRTFRGEFEAHVLEKRCPAVVCSKLFRSPCQDSCPIGMDVPAYIALIRTGRIDDAYKILKRTNPFPSVCGRICGQDCQMKCRRGRLDEPIAIMHLKRFITENANRTKPQVLPTLRKEKVAIVGAGPSGLAAALELRKRGYGVTVFDESPEAGGMLRWSIPAFRLPRKDIDRDIEEILQTGVQLRTGTRVGRDVPFEELERDFDIIYLAPGAQKSSPLGIPGEGAEGVLGAVQFLRAFCSGKEIGVGRNVAVIGGGLLAFDAARTAVRLGAKKVTLYYRRERRDLPAPWAIKAAEGEGVRIMDLVAPVRIVTQYGRVTRLELTAMRLGKFDRSGRKLLIPILGSEFIEKADTVISAVGQVANLDFFTSRGGIEEAQSRIRVDKNFRTSNPKVWAGGDVITGSGMIMDAISSGLQSARAMDEAIRSANGEKPWAAPEEDPIKIPFEAYPETGNHPHVPMPEVAADLRRKDFREVELGYTLEMALAEAHRCLRCDLAHPSGNSAHGMIKGTPMTTRGEILIVDDDPDLQESLRIILENHGYRVRTAANGPEALQSLKSNKPDLMILDVMMNTETEGFDLAYDLKKTPGFENLPIILLTSFLEKVRTQGPDKFKRIMEEEWPARWLFEKPIDTKKLLAKIEGILAGASS